MKKGIIFFLAFFSTGMAAWAQSDTLRVLGDAVVTGTRGAADIRHLPMTVSVVGRQALTENERVNVLPTLSEQVPGLFVTSRGLMGYGVSNGAAGGLSLRGMASASGQLLVLIDGHPQYNGIYGHSIGDSYQTLMAERVEVVRGPASVIYGGNAMGGVVNIVTRGAKRDGHHTHINIGAGSYGSFQSEASHQWRKGKFNLTTAAQYSRTDNHRPHMGFEQYGGFVKVGYDFNRHWAAFANADVTHFNASYPGSVDKPMLEADQWITRGVVTAAVENHYENTEGGLSVYHNFGRHKINDGYEAGKAPQTRFFRSSDALTGVSLYQSARFFRGNRITAGVDFQHIYGHAFYTSRATGEILDTPNKQSGRQHMNGVAGYVELRQDIADWLSLDAGLRLDWHSVAGTEWIPQGGIVVRPTANGELKAMVGKGFRNPTMREMYLYPPSNEELLPERLVNYEISWHQRLMGGLLTYGVNLFYLHADNLIQTVNKKNVNTGELKNCGAEAELTWNATPWLRLTTNHSVLHMKTHVIGAPEYKGYVGATVNKDRWNIAADVQHIAGLFTAVGSAETRENFTLLNMKVGYRIAQPLVLWLRGENLLAQRYEINAGYPMPRATFMGGINLHF